MLWFADRWEISLLSLFCLFSSHRLMSCWCYCAYLALKWREKTWWYSISWLKCKFISLRSTPHSSGAVSFRAYGVKAFPYPCLLIFLTSNSMMGIWDTYFFPVWKYSASLPHQGDEDDVSPASRCKVRTFDHKWKIKVLTLSSHISTSFPAVPLIGEFFPSIIFWTHIGPYIKPRLSSFSAFVIKCWAGLGCHYECSLVLWFYLCASLPPPTS